SPVDEIVGIDNAARLYDMARHPKSFVSLDRADHLLTDTADSRYVAAVLAAWASRYVQLGQGPSDLEELRDADRAVTRTGSGTFHTDIAIRDHYLVADEPESVGGEDAGPTPYDLLVAGLGACTSMTLQMYAGRKEWPLEEARVRLKHRKVHAQDCQDCEEDGDRRLDVVEREVELIGELDDEQRARLMEIADRCPVHRTLNAGVRVRTTEVPRPEGAADASDRGPDPYSPGLQPEA
ncbi:MAG: OsmC family protein, partial [Longimicrobiales bacterium]|nr:OsmC family protein [Longimicrobiales bacterium]